MKKRILSLLMAVCLMTTLVSVCSISASAAEDGLNHVYVRGNKAKPGEMLEVPISADFSDGVACLTFTPTYDHSALELVAVENELGIGSFLYNEDPANPKFIWYNTENCDFSGSGGVPLFTLVFQVKSSAREGTYPVTMEYNENDICNENGSRIPLTVEAGEIVIFRYLLADVDNDLFVGSSDVVKLARYLVYLETEINTYGADVNKDGEIDGRDLVKLSRYMVGLEAIDGIIYY